MNNHEYKVLRNIAELNAVEVKWYYPNWYLRKKIMKVLKSRGDKHNNKPWYEKLQELDKFFNKGR